jgi:hypothetical protein
VWVDGMDVWVGVWRVVGWEGALSSFLSYIFFVPTSFFLFMFDTSSPFV